MQATIELLKTAGPAGATARAICAEVGVKQPALYYHYGQLDNLHNQAVSAVFQQMADYYPPSGSTASAFDSIRSSWQLFTRFSLENPSLFSFVNGQIVKGELPESVSLAFANLVKDLELAASIKTLRMSAFDAAQMLWAGANGAATLAAASRVNEVAEQMLEALLAYLFSE